MGRQVQRSVGNSNMWYQLGLLQLDGILYRPMVVRRNRIIIRTMRNGYTKTGQLTPKTI